MWERDPLIRALQCLYCAESATDAEKRLHLSPWSADEEDGSCLSEAGVPYCLNNLGTAQKCSDCSLQPRTACFYANTHVASKMGHGWPWDKTIVMTCYEFNWFGAAAGLEELVPFITRVCTCQDPSQSSQREMTLFAASCLHIVVAQSLCMYTYFSPYRLCCIGSRNTLCGFVAYPGF